MTARKSVWAGCLLAALFSASPLLIMFYGMLGLQGSSPVTGMFLVVLLAALGVTTYSKPNGLAAADFFFACFIACVFASFLKNGWTADTKEVLLFGLSLSAYPVCRQLSESTWNAAEAPFIWTLLIIGGVGTSLTTFYLIDQWHSLHGRPVFFGFSDAAPTLFFTVACILLFAVMTFHRLSKRQWIVVAALVLLLAAVYAASVVRYSFVALVCGLGSLALISDRSERWRVLGVIVAVIAGVAIGLGARHAKTKIFADYLFEQNAVLGAERQQDAGRPPSCYLEVNAFNSVAIRKALVQDALVAIPKAGAFGLGLDEFRNQTCIKDTQVHISLLQAMVELGWIGGLCWLAFILSCLLSILRKTGSAVSARFAFVLLVFMGVLSFAHGRLSRDLSLFATAGLAVGVGSNAIDRKARKS